VEECYRFQYPKLGESLSSEMRILLDDSVIREPTSARCVLNENFVPRDCVLVFQSPSSLAALNLDHLVTLWEPQKIESLTLRTAAGDRLIVA
jgi:hypothetical protein